MGLINFGTLFKKEGPQGPSEVRMVRAAPADLSQTNPVTSILEPVARSELEPSVSELQPYVRYGLRFADGLIESTDSLMRVPFVACLNEKLGLAPHQFVTMAVVQVSHNNKTAVLLLSPTVTQSHIDGVTQLLEEKGWSLPANGPQAWACTPSITMSVSQGHLNDRTLSAVRSIQSDSGKSALWHSFVNIVQWAFDRGANDIDFAMDLGNVMSQVAFKIEGRYVRPTRWRLPTDTLLQMLGIAWQRSSGGGDANFQLKIEQQGQLEIDLANGVRVRLRWNGMAFDAGPVVTLRIHRLGGAAVITTLEGAGYLPWHLEVLTRILRSKGGLTTLAGTVGSGKSVTLAILMSMLPDHAKKISFEDPVEIDQPGVYQKTIARDLVQTGDMADAAFAAAVRTLFRSALDIFLLGEVRDVPTGRVARAVLESGHSTFTTTHAKSALGVFSKYMDPNVGIPVDTLGTPGNIRLNVYQALVPKTCPHCGLSPTEYVREFRLDGSELSDHQRYIERIEQLYRFDSEQMRLRNPHGCPHCRKPELEALNGFMSRTVVAEMVEPDEDMCELILAGRHVELMRYWRSLSDGRYDSANLAGKTAMEVGMYQASMGVLDPREVEANFDSFATIEHRRNTKSHAVVPLTVHKSQIAGSLSCAN